MKDSSPSSVEKESRKKNQADKNSVTPGEDIIRENEASEQPEAAVASENGDTYTPADLSAKLEQLSEENDRLRDQMLRARSEFENYKRRRVIDMERLEADAREVLIRDMIEILDDFDMMISRTKPDDSAEAIMSGAQMIRQKLFDALSRRGLEKIEAKGKEFDPDQHEALMQHPSDEVPPGTIIMVHQEGYRLAGKLIRPSRVVISSQTETE